MALLQLPNELLTTILDFSRPYAFEDLVVTCKRMYSAARPLLSHHNELRRKYRHFRFARTDEYPTSTRSVDALTWFVPQILLDIARNPMVAAYIVHADFGQRNYTEDCYCQGGENLRIPVQQLDEAANKDMIRDLVQGSWFLRAIGGDADQWLECILKDDSEWEEICEFGLAFLMSLLVNVESLTLPGTWKPPNAEPRERREGGIEPYQYEVSQLMQFLVKMANDVTTQQWPLKKLRKLNPSRDPDAQFGLEMISIAPFLSLESMREVKHECGKYICYGGSPPWDTMYPVIGPNIEKLELLDYIIDHEASKTFFKDMKKLRVFKLEYWMKDEIGDEWSPNEFVQNLMSAVGSHLEVLSLMIGEVYANEDPVTDLSGFTALQSLELDVELFQRWDNINDEDDPDYDDEEVSLLEMLPDSLPSLKELQIECLPLKTDVRRLEILLRDFGSAKSLQLPNLVRTGVYMDPDGRSSLRSVTDREPHVQQARKTCAETGGIEFTTTKVYMPGGGRLLVRVFSAQMVEFGEAPESQGLVEGTQVRC